MKELCGWITIVVLLVGVTAPVQAQDEEENAAGSEALQVFVDCSGFRCDLDYVRQEVQFINYVRDRTDAELHVLITTQSTGSGGTEFTLTFIGKKRFAGRGDTLAYTSAETQTDDEVRQGLVRTFKAGLMQYVSKTPLFDDIAITYKPPAEEQRVRPEEDPWNYWIFRSRVNGWFNGEQRQNRLNLSGSVSANRTTRHWKIDLGINGSYRESNFELSQGQTVSSTQHNYGSDLMVVKSLSDHWSTGVLAGAEVSTFSNYDLSVRVSPAIEYNLFPYRISTRKQLRILYQIEPHYFNYQQVTIFNELAEWRVEQELEITADINQPWGSLRTSLEGSHYFYDFTKNNLDLFSDLELRLYRGLSLNLFGSVALIRNQLNLPKEEATEEEILLRRRELATNYRYYVSIGLSYTFGSIYNNIVNPRFGSRGHR